jgi:hypothetical protein
VGAARRFGPRSVCAGHHDRPQHHQPGLRAIHYDKPVGLLAARARTWERRCYSKAHFTAIAALSRRDLAYLQSLPDAPALLLTPPGMPPCVPLAPTAGLNAELVVAGTYGWAPVRSSGLVIRRTSVLCSAPPAPIFTSLTIQARVSLPYRENGLENTPSRSHTPNLETVLANIRYAA